MSRKKPFAARPGASRKLVELAERRESKSERVWTKKFLPNVLELRIDSNVAWSQRCNDEGAKALAQVMNRLENTLRLELGRPPFGDEIVDAIIASIHVNFGV